MLLLRDGAAVSAAPRPRLDDESPMPDDAASVTLPLDRYLALDADQAAAVRGVALAPADDPQKLAHALAGLDLVTIDFPVYTDGRGYSQARILRRLGFGGELRATGDVRLDQLLFMCRVGIDGAEMPGPVADAELAALFGRYPGSYQPSYAPVDGRAAVRPPGA